MPEELPRFFECLLGLLHVYLVFCALFNLVAIHESFITVFSLAVFMVFCPVCGEEAVDVFCEEHLREQEPLVEEVKQFSLTICSTCDRFMDRGSWEDFKRFERFVKRHVKYNSRARIVEVHFPLPVFTGKPEDFEMPFEVAGTVSKFVEPYVEEYVFNVPVELSQCDRCSQAKSGYFEGILQLRNPREEVVSYISKAVAGAEGAQISNVADVKGGVDFELSNKQFLVTFVHELQRRFGGVVRKSSKLHTYDHQRSKKVYRLTCLLQLPAFWEGDIIETPKKLLRVSKMGSVVKGFDLRNRKKTAAQCPADEDVEVLESFTTTVSRTRPRVMILDPHDYQEVALAHPAELRAGEEVSVVEDSSGRWYLSSLQQ